MLRLLSENKKHKAANGAVIYRGPSELDGSPIVAIASGIVTPSSNRKTGPMLQVFILQDDVDPFEASRTGADLGICGHCGNAGLPWWLVPIVAMLFPFRLIVGKVASLRTCYVSLLFHVIPTWKAYRKGDYADICNNPDLIQQLGRNVEVRIGAYGDGAAVPRYVWRALLKYASGWTAYSHQAEWEGSSYDPTIYMRSCDDLQEAQRAWANGERTTRVIQRGDYIAPNERRCPNETTDGRIQCIDCLLCSGTTGKGKYSIVFEVHGSGAKWLKYVPQVKALRAKHLPKPACNGCACNN